jgi:hypothetical protein
MECREFEQLRNHQLIKDTAAWNSLIKGWLSSKIFKKLKSVCSRHCALLLHGPQYNFIYENPPGLDLRTVRTIMLCSSPSKLTIHVRTVEENKVFEVWGYHSYTDTTVRSCGVGNCDVRFRDPDVSEHSTSGISNLLQEDSHYEE